MKRQSDRAARAYRAPLREDGALRTRRLITKAAKETFERHGWSGATVATIAERAGVSQSTVEAVFGTKPALLQAAVDYAIRGDIDPVPIRGREITTRIEAAPDAVSMLELHAAHLRGVQSRSAHLAFVVEQAAKSDKGVAALWRRMNENRRYGVEWAARTLLAKPGVEHLRADDVEKTFWVALDWGNYRLLTDYTGLSADGYQQWILDYYLRMFDLRG
jgi:AcrR family transcriptional regulator